MDMSANHAPITATDCSFAADVLHSPVPVVVDFWAPWCLPCRAIAPIRHELAVAYTGRLVVAKLNADDELRTVADPGVQGLCKVLVFRDGLKVDRLVGARSSAEYRARFERVLG